MSSAPPDPRKAAERFFAALRTHARALLERWLAAALPPEPDLADVVALVCDTWLAPADMRVRHGALFVFANQKVGFPLFDSPLGHEELKALFEAAASPKLFGVAADEGGHARFEQFRFNGLAPREELGKAAVHGLRKLCAERCAGQPAAVAKIVAELREELRRYRDSKARDFAKAFLGRALGA